MRPEPSDEAARWREIDAVLDRLLDRPEREQARLLDALCGDAPWLRAEVEPLLAADREAGDFLAVPAAEALAVDGEPETPAPVSRIGDRVGPYRLLRELGRGGMGEVYEAYDERLDRTVAVKRVRLGGGDERGRRRFRGEARLAAGLRHPAVVAVHDLVEWDDEDWLVMELLEGQTLAEHAGGRALDEDRVVDLGLRIADALDAAHRAGILHRDLKTENVLLDGAGRVKLVDFGLATRIGTGPETVHGDVEVAGAGLDTSTGGDSVTARGRLQGTVRAMSPEQARGEPVGPPSDLFSLGILLYELATGVSPFLAPTTLETLRAIVHRPHRPAREHNPRVSRRLSDLLDRLLAKDPEHRPPDAATVRRLLAGCSRASRRRRWARWAAGWLVAASFGTLGLWQATRVSVPRYVAVPEPRIAGAASGLRDGPELLAAGTHSALLRTLSRLDGLAALPVTPAQVDGAGGDTVGLARELGADEILESRLDCPDARCRVRLSRRSAADGSILWAKDFEAPVEHMAWLDTAVTTRLQEAYDDHRPRSGHRPAVDETTYRAYLELSRDYRARRRPLPDLLADTAARREAAPDFLELYLLEAEMARDEFHAGHDPRWLRRGLDLLERAAELRPDDRRVPQYLFDFAQESGRWNLAETALAALQELEPGGAAALQREAELLEHRGETERALELMRQATRQRPSPSHRFNLALMEIRFGEMTAARSTLETLLESNADDYKAVQLLAQIELLEGSVDRAVELFTRLADTEPTSDVLLNLGAAHLLRGDPRRAETRFTQADRLEPDSAVVLLNLADSLELQERHGEARRLYARVLELAPEAPVSEAWQRASIRAQALAHLGRAAEARRAAEQALDQAGDHPLAAFEAALVFTLIGDTPAAEAQMDRARDLGLDARWFSLPWFTVGVVPVAALLGR